MAKAERQPKPQSSTVASCAARDCRHNEDRNCTAGQIQLEVRQGQVMCATYEPEQPRPRP